MSFIDSKLQSTIIVYELQVGSTSTSSLRDIRKIIYGTYKSKTMQQETFWNYLAQLI